MSHPFILLVGPTASGKSALGLKLAEHYGAGILNCDSLQAYQRLDIGTAKPSIEERALCPHYLFDEVQPPNVLTAGDFRKRALEILEKEIPQRTVFGVGGSGFYIQALEKGMFNVPKPKAEVERDVRDRLEREGLEAMYSELRELDPDYAEKLNPNDAYRITRALIMIHDSGKQVSEIRRAFTTEAFPYPLLKLGLAPSRDELLPRVIARTQAMLDAGLVAEVQRLKEDGLSAWAPLQSVGYKECLQFLNGDVKESDLAALITEKTMQLAKKQKTWFKRDDNTHWLHPADPLTAAIELIDRRPWTTGGSST